MSDTLLRHLRATRDWLKLPQTPEEHERLKENFRNADPPLQRPESPRGGITTEVFYATLKKLAEKPLPKR